MIQDSPTTPILDDFNRADENPLSGGGNWLTADSALTVNFRIVSNTARSTSLNNRASFYWTRFLTWDFEVYMTTTVRDGGEGVLGRIQQVGGSGIYDAYAFVTFAIGSRQYEFRRITNNSAGTVIFFTSSGPILGDGDSMMMRGIGNIFICSVKSASESFWRTIFVGRDPAPLPSAGYIGMHLGSTHGVNTQIDDFGGGPLSGSLGSPIPAAPLGRGLA